MTSDRFDRTLRAFQRRTPFRSFTVELMSGDRFEVDHPEALVARDGVAVFIARREVPTLFDHESVSQFMGECARNQRDDRSAVAAARFVPFVLYRGYFLFQEQLAARRHKRRKKNQ